MASILLVWLCLISMAAALSLLFQKRFELCVPAAAATAVLLPYAFGLLGLLTAGIAAVDLIGLASLAYVIVAAVKKRALPELFTPGLLVYFCFVLLAWWAHRHRVLSAWDELSHWGLAVKNMAELGALPSVPASTVYFKDYPPAMALFQLLFVKASGSLRESDLFTASNLFYFSMIMPLFARTEWKRPARWVLYAALTLVLPLAFYQDFYSSILVDGILGVLFGMILYFWYSGEPEGFTFLNLSLLLATLALMKKSGSAIALLALVLLCVDACFHRRRGLRGYILGGNRAGRIVAAASPALALAAAWLTWSLCLHVWGVEPTFQVKDFNLHSLTALFVRHEPAYRVMTFEGFARALNTQAVSTGTVGGMSFVLWLVALAAPALLLVFREPDPAERQRWKTAAVGLYACAAAYLMSLLFLYLFAYSDYEATRLASYSRYVGTILLGMAAFLLPLLLQRAETRGFWKPEQAGAWALLACLLVTNLSPLVDMTALAPASVRSTLAKRSPYSSVSAAVAKVGRHSRVYVLSIGDEGYDYQVCKYLFTPTEVETPREGWSIGSEPYYTGDVWTVATSPALWAQDLKNSYAYVYIYKTNPQFSQQYQGLFEGGAEAIRDKTLYRIDKSGDSVRLTPVVAG